MVLRQAVWDGRDPISTSCPHSFLRHAQNVVCCHELKFHVAICNQEYGWIYVAPHGRSVAPVLRESSVRLATAPCAALRKSNNI